MTKNNQPEGLKFARLLMVLSSLSPLFVLWAVRGVKNIPDIWLWTICASLILVPYLVLLLRLWIVWWMKDFKTLTIGEADDHREHLLVYLFAMLIPLYDANLGSTRDILATALAFAFIVFLFWHLNLHYMNILFALFNYRVFAVYPNTEKDAGQQSFVLLTCRGHLETGQEIRAYRLSNTVFFEPKGGI